MNFPYKFEQERLHSEEFVLSKMELLKSSLH